ncbi:Bug family tripartite tricarboxylate transporter substrate binding protein [Roseomonas sp. WA12]
MTMQTAHSRRALLGAGASLLAAPALRAQPAWPVRPIRWIINFPPGGAADTLSRVLVQQIGNELGQPIVLENRVGAGGMVGADIVAKARGDAHVVIMSSGASHGTGPVLYRSVPYDALGDFTHLHLVGTFSCVLAVNNDLPAKDVAEFVALAKTRPVIYGSGGNGTLNHLVGQLLARDAGITLEHVPYRGSAAALTDTMGGQIPCLMESLPIVLPHLQANRLRPLAVSGPERDSTLPDVPTFAEAGYPGATATSWFGFSAAAGIPDAVSDRWQKVIGEALKTEFVKERFGRIGVTPGTLDRAGYTALVQEELDRWRPVIAAARITAD